MSKPKLTYFKAAGRGELPRLILEHAGVDYEYNAVTDWANQKQELAEVLTFGQIPLYQDSEVTLVQSQAIARYLGRKHGLAGANEVEAAKIDMLNEGIVELFGKLVSALFGSAESKAAGTKTLHENLGKLLTPYENILAKSHSGFLVGDKVSYADLHLYFGVGALQHKLGSEIAAELEKFPKVKALAAHVGNIERIKAYQAKNVYG